MTQMFRVFSVSSVAIAAAACCMFSCNNVGAGSTVYVGRDVAGRVAFDKVDHKPWDVLLRKYVDDDGYVNYQAWHTSKADRASLQQYLNSLSVANPKARSSKNGQLAFWINAYNAVTIHGILHEYPTTSIRNHTAKLFGYNIWQDLQIYVSGKPWSLEGIEHEVLRKMGEPRIHFAIVCASIGCPRLLNRAYTMADVQKQLADNSTDFFSRPQNFRFDPRGNVFHFSEIMSWYGADFGADQRTQLKAVAAALPKGEAQSAAQSGNGTIRFLKYDWNLNDQKTRR